MTRLSLVAFACLLTTGFADAQSAGDKSVQRLDPALDALVSPEAKVELVKGGFGFTEGPVWMQEGKSGFLLFTDIPGDVVWKLSRRTARPRSISTTPATTDPTSGAGAASRTTAASAPIRDSRSSP